MPDFNFDESMIKDGIKSAIANYYRALLIKTKDEEESKKEVLCMLKELCTPYMEANTVEKL